MGIQIVNTETNTSLKSAVGFMRIHALDIGTYKLFRLIPLAVEDVAYVYKGNTLLQAGIDYTHSLQIR